MRYFAPQPASLAYACKYAAICTTNLPRNNQPLLVAFYTSYLKYLVAHKETTTSIFCVCYYTNINDQISSLTKMFKISKRLPQR